MRFFAAIDLQHLVLALFLGLAGAFVIYLAFRYGTMPRRRREGELPERPPEGHEEDRAVPPVLVFVYVGVVLWILFYVMIFISRGAAF